MPGKRQVRSNAYYEERLERDHRSIYDDLIAGKHKSPAEAFRVAGLKKGRTRLLELKNAWSKASAAEQRDFDDWRKPKSATAGIAASSVPSGRQMAFNSDRRLLPWATKRIQHIMVLRRMKMGDLMNELGLDTLNASIAMALWRGYRINDAHVADKLEQWLADNREK